MPISPVKDAHMKGGPRGSLMLAKKHGYACILVHEGVRGGCVSVLVLHPFLVFEEDLHCSLMALVSAHMSAVIPVMSACPFLWRLLLTA